MRHPSQGAAFEATAAALEAFSTLRAMHYDAARGQFLDFGNHSEAVELRWAMVKAHPQDPGSPRLLRMVTQPPRERLVPHFGWAPKQCICKFQCMHLQISI